MSGAVALRAVAAALLALGVVPLANFITAGSAVPWYGGAVREWAQRGVLLALLTLLLARALGPRIDTLVDRGRRSLMALSPRAFAWTVGVSAVAAAAFVSLWAFAGRPFTSDEMAQLFHARIIASGHLTGVAETAREFFNTAPVLDSGGTWYSQYPVGGPAIVAIGVLTGAAWLVNPLLLGLAAVLLYRFLALVATETVARAASVVFVLSPMVLLMAGSQMNHMPALVLALAALWQAARWDAAADAREQRRQAVSAGLAFGAIALLRPLDAAIVGAIIVAVQVARARGEPARWASVAAGLAAAAIPALVLLAANMLTTGRPLLFAYEALNGPAHGIGFHVDPTGDEHTPLRGLTYASGYLMRLSLFLLEWPLPGVLLCALGMLALRHPRRWDVALAGLIIVQLAGYAAYWFDGFFAGPRFLFSAVPAFVYFVVRAPQLADAAPAVVRRAAALAIPACLLVAWLGPWGVSSASSRIALHREQRTKLKTDVEAQVEREQLTRPALVFVNEGWRGSLQARLRVLGASSFSAERLLNTVDACALQTALDDPLASSLSDPARLEQVVRRARAAGTPRLVPNLPADQAIALVPGSTPTPTCLAEFSRDSLGTMPYAMFLARQHVDRDGRIGGDVVYARDLGSRNETLRSRFGDRAWYRYRPARSLEDTTRVFIPLP